MVDVLLETLKNILATSIMVQSSYSHVGETFNLFLIDYNEVKVTQFDDIHAYIHIYI